MATKKKSKRVQSSKSKVRSFAAMEAQIAELQEQIALLEAGGMRHEENSSRERSEAEGKRSDRGVRSPAQTGLDHASPHSGHSVRPLRDLSAFPAAVSPRAKLTTPVIEEVTAVGPRLRVTWGAVANATGYNIRWATDAGFVNNNGSMQVGATLTTAVVSGLQPETLYYVRMQALAGAGDTDSDYSVAKSAVTGTQAGDETVTHLQGWLADLQTLFENVATRVPPLESTELNTTDRRRLNGSGVRRYGFIEKTADVAGDFPQFWPAIVEDAEKLNTLVLEIEAYRNLLIWFRYATRVVGDLLLIAGDQAFRLAGAYYAAARDGARRKNPEAQQVFNMLRLFWHRRRNPTEPTEKEVMRDVRALLRGTKDGRVVIENESDTVTKGKRTFIDNTRKKPRNNFKEIETGKVELSEE